MRTVDTLRAAFMFQGFYFFESMDLSGVFFVRDSLSYYKRMIKAETHFVQQFFVSVHILTAWLD